LHFLPGKIVKIVFIMVETVTTAFTSTTEEPPKQQTEGAPATETSNTTNDIDPSRKCKASDAEDEIKKFGGDDDDDEALPQQLPTSCLVVDDDEHSFVIGHDDSLERVPNFGSPIVVPLCRTVAGSLVCYHLSFCNANVMYITYTTR
jgi:hypothetical protein